jgi:hypothetical protein
MLKAVKKLSTIIKNTATIPGANLSLLYRHLNGIAQNLKHKNKNSSIPRPLVGSTLC